MKLSSIIILLLVSNLLFCQNLYRSHNLCDYQMLIDSVPEHRKAETEKLYLSLVGVLERLSAYRSNYLNTGNLENLFPTVYYHMTGLEMNNIRQGKYKNPEWKLNQMLSFYEAYEINKINWNTNNLNKVEPHWINHFEIAKKENENLNFLCLSLQRTLNTAVLAHVVYDLPRSIRYSLKNKNNTQIKESLLKKEFIEVNKIFDKAFNYLVKDAKIGTGLFCGIGIKFGSIFIPNDIITKRESAWDDGSNRNKELKYKNYILTPQSNNLALSNHFFEIGKKLCPQSSDASLFLFDLSGSMNSNGAGSSISKIAQAQKAAIATLDVLEQTNQSTEVSILGFSNSCSSPIKTGIDFVSDYSKLKTFIVGLSAGGGTPLAEAIEIAECKLADQLAQNGAQSGKLLILSDGAATCKSIRPNGVYYSPSGTNTTVQARQCGSGNNTSGIKYNTIGFNISPGSSAERDLQYLSQSTGGKYLNVQSQTQLVKAFRKFNRTYTPKPNPSLTKITSESDKTFKNGVTEIEAEEFEDGLKSCSSYIKENPDDCNGRYNLALVQEANDLFGHSIENYKAYLTLCPDAADKESVEKQIKVLEKDFEEYKDFQKKVIMSDLAYLEHHFEQIQNGSSIALAAEFKGFLKEKGNYYLNLPKLLMRKDRPFKKNTKEVAEGLNNCAKTIKRNPESWDRDATPALSMTYLNLERLVNSF